MRAELPWNIAGIPPEAREAARAAARREGLSVGEWMTRRILRSFSGMEEDAMPIERAHLDAWGLPPSNAARRDTEDMLARVGRSEAESSEVFRRIEDHMRGLSRRLDSSERSHSESNRVLSRTAQEINIATREQAQAFDQLGLNVMALAERLERVERSAVSDGIREAVKALHQGLSRLADQVTQTASNSATQAGNLATSLEQLASRLGAARVDSEDADKQLAQRIMTVENVAHKNAAHLDDRLTRFEETAGAGLDALEQRIEKRLANAEKTAESHTSAINHALEKIDTAASARAAEQVESQRRAAFVEENIQGLRDAIERMEARATDPALEQRLGHVEQHLGSIIERLDRESPAAPLQQSLESLTKRLESLEQNHNDLLAEVRTGAHHAQDIPPIFENQNAAHIGNEPPQPLPGAFDVPPFPEAEAESRPGFGYSTPAQASFQPDPFADGSPDQFLYGNDASEHAPPPEAASSLLADNFPPHVDYEPHFEAPPEPASSDSEPENFLAQARRTARTAAEKAEAGRQRHGFPWSRTATASGEDEGHPRYIIPAAIALIVALAVAAGLVLSQRASIRPADNSSPAPGKSAANDPNFTLPQPPGDETQFVVAPAVPTDNSAQTAQPASGRSSTATPASRTTGKQSEVVRNAPVHQVPDSANQVSLTRVAQLAAKGNPAAEAILGLRYLDGTGGTERNMPQAVKYLTAAAEHGQAVAQYRLGTLYERGDGVTASGAKASHWYQLAANQGNRKAMHNLAVAYASGSTGKKDMAEAARWFTKAAALGLSDSQFNLAVLYERGDGVPQSLTEAYKWYSIAAATGDSESKARVAVLRSQLSDSDRATAEKSAATFHAAPLNRSANVPPEPADLG